MHHLGHCLLNFFYSFYAFFFNTLKNLIFKIFIIAFYSIFLYISILNYDKIEKSLLVLPIIHLPSFLIGNYFGESRSKIQEIKKLNLKLCFVISLLISLIYKTNDLLITLGVLTLPIAFFIFYLSFINKTILINKYFIKMGELSYSIYILAFPLESFFNVLMGKYVNGYIYLLIYLLVLILIAKLIEVFNKKYIYAYFNKII